MSIPTICPHCNEFFVSDNEPGNPFCLCPKCGRWMNLKPPPKKKRRRKSKGPIKCPLCGAQMSPGTDTCLKCRRQIVTGEALPLYHRLALVPTTHKMIALCGLLAVLVLIVVVVQLIVGWVGQPSRPAPGPTVIGDSPEAVRTRELLAKLTGEGTEADKAKMGVEFGNVGPDAVPLILKALEDKTLTDAARSALIVGLGEIGDSRGADAAARAMETPRFRLGAMIGLALMGDARAVEPMADHFISEVRHASIGVAMVRRTLLSADSDTAELERAWADRLAHVRRPVAALGVQILPRLLTTYWLAWNWPMRDRGAAWMDQIDDVVTAMSLEDTATETLVGLLTDRSPDVRLAAAVLLGKRRGVGTREAEGWAGKIADLLAHDRLDVRQRAVWTVATVTNRTFGRYAPAQPLDQVPALALTEAAQWLKRRTGRDVKISASLLAQHELAPPVPRRTYHPARVEARRAIEGLAEADWRQARTRWRDLSALPADAAPAVRPFLEGDVRKLKVPARLIVLQLLAQWRDRASVRPMARLSGLLDNPPWMAACLAVAQTSAKRDGRTDRWVDLVADVESDLLDAKQADRGLIPADFARLLASQGRPALVALHRDQRFHRSGSRLLEIYTNTKDAMVRYGWPVSVWNRDLGGR